MTISTPPTDTAPAEDRPRLSACDCWRATPSPSASAIVLACLAFVAVTAQWIAPFGINDIDVPNALRPPGGEHWFGTTNSAATSSPECWWACRLRCALPW